MGYIGNEPTTGHFPVDNFTSSGGSTYTLTRAPASAGAIEVSVQGVLQPTTAYTVSGTTLTMAGVTTGVKIFVRHLGETLSLPTPADGSVTTAKLGTNSVTTGKIAAGAVELADMQSGTAGDTLYYNPAPTRLAKGTAAQVLTMNAGATAPEWAAAGGGAWNMVGTSEASTSASLTVTGLDSTYDNYAIGISDMTPDSDTNNAYLRLGDSSGIDSGGSDYAWHLMRNKSDNSSYSGQVNNSTSSIQMAAGGTVAGEGMGAMLYLNRPADGTLWPIIHGTCVGRGHATSQLESGVISGVRLSGISVDRVQIFWGAGNIVTGRLTVWGISHT